MSSVWKKMNQMNKRLFAQKQAKEIPALIKSTERSIRKSRAVYQFHVDQKNESCRHYLGITESVWAIVCSDCKRRLYKLSQIAKQESFWRSKVVEERNRRRRDMELDEAILDVYELGEDADFIIDQVEKERKNSYIGMEEAENQRRMGQYVDEAVYARWVRDNVENRMDES